MNNMITSPTMCESTYILVPSPKVYSNKKTSERKNKHVTSEFKPIYLQDEVDYIKHELTSYFLEIYKRFEFTDENLMQKTNDTFELLLSENEKLLEQRNSQEDRIEDFISMIDAKEKFISDMIAKNSDHESEILKMNLTYEAVQTKKNEDYECTLKTYASQIAQLEKNKIINDEKFIESKIKFENKINKQVNEIEKVKAEFMEKDAQCLKKDLEYAYSINKIKMGYEKKYKKACPGNSSIKKVKSEYDSQLKEKNALIEAIQNKFDRVINEKNNTIEDYNVKNEQNQLTIESLKNNITLGETNIEELKFQLKNTMAKMTSPNIKCLISPKTSTNKKTTKIIDSFQTKLDESCIDEKDEQINKQRFSIKNLGFLHFFFNFLFISIIFKELEIKVLEIEKIYEQSREINTKMSEREDNIEFLRKEIIDILNEKKLLSDEIDYFKSEIENKEKIIQNQNEFNLNHQTKLESSNLEYQEQITTLENKLEKNSYYIEKVRDEYKAKLMELYSSYDNHINKKDIEYKTMQDQKNIVISKINLENRDLLLKFDNASEENRELLLKFDNVSEEYKNSEANAVIDSSCENQQSFDEIKKNMQKHGMNLNNNHNKEIQSETGSKDRNHLTIKNMFLT